LLGAGGPIPIRKPCRLRLIAYGLDSTSYTARKGAEGTRTVTEVQVHFCDLRNTWQRGCDENTIGLLPQYFRKGTNLSGNCEAQLNKIALRLNQRSRKTLGFETPADRLGAVLQ
jgi:IS30 family transposase